MPWLDHLPAIPLARGVLWGLDEARGALDGIAARWLRWAADEFDREALARAIEEVTRG